MDAGLDTLRKKVLADFTSLPYNNPKKADDFFMKFGVGNTISDLDQPFERFIYYEFLLDTLMNSDFEKYQNIHKGIPFYFLAWLAFDFRNYEKALYYIDSAISEDIKNAEKEPFKLPASNFLLLNPEKQVASRTIQIICLTLEEEISRFNSISKSSELSPKLFIDKFVLDLIKKPENRTIISAFYVFLLEYSERQKEIKMRSSEGGSIAPFILHLFSGALIFESILKYLYPYKKKKIPNQTIGEIFHNSSFLQIYPPNIPTYADSILNISNEALDNSLFTAFSTTAKIRNTAGHNLVWDNTIFSETEKYQILFQQEVNAILYLVVNNF